MSDDQSPEALRIAAIGDLRKWAKHPHLYPQQSVLEIAVTLWNVYLSRSMLYHNFDAFLDDCVRLVGLANIRATQAERGGR